MKKQQLLGSIYALAGGAMWGISGSIGQYMFSVKGLSALWLTPIRLFLSGFLLLAFYLAKDPKLAVKPWKEKEDRKQLLIYGLLGISMCQLFYFGTIQLSSAGVATILQDVSPVMILACTCIAAGRKPFGNEIISILLALVGVTLIVTHGDFRQFAVSPLALLTGMVCAVGVTIYNVYPQKLISAYPIPLLQGWAFLMGGSLFALIFRPWTYAVALDGQILLGIAGVVIIGNLLAFTFYMKGVAMIGPNKAILYGFSEPVTAALIAFLWLGTDFTLWDAIGFACIFLMLVLLGLPRKEKTEDR